MATPSHGRNLNPNNLLNTFSDENVISNADINTLTVSEKMLAEAKNDQFSEELMSFFLLETMNSPHYSEKTKSLTLTISNEMVKEFLRFCDNRRKYGEDLSKIKMKSVLLKENIFLMSYKNKENYWELYLIQNIASLFKREYLLELFTEEEISSQKKKFKIYYFNASNLISNSISSKEFLKYLKDYTKTVITNIFQLINSNFSGKDYNIYDHLENKAAFKLATFEVTVKELHLAKNPQDSGTCIANVLLECLSALDTEDSLDRIDFGRLTLTHCITNVRDILFNTLSMIKENKNPYKKFESSKKGGDVSTTIISRDSRNIMNSCIDELVGDKIDYGRKTAQTTNSGKPKSRFDLVYSLNKAKTDIGRVTATGTPYNSEKTKSDLIGKNGEDYTTGAGRATRFKPIRIKIDELTYKAGHDKKITRTETNERVLDFEPEEYEVFGKSEHNKLHDWTEDLTIQHTHENSFVKYVPPEKTVEKLLAIANSINHEFIQVPDARKFQEVVKKGEEEDPDGGCCKKCVIF